MRLYPAKLLLFGEHILLTGAPALALPAPAFAGHWAEATLAAGKQKRLLEFADSEALSLIPGLLTSAFRRDIEQGLLFESNIPTGYGLGSSGALCAAIYDRYCTEKTEDLAALKNLLAQMENFFHGSSSGIDPLTSYLAKPVLIEHKKEARLAPLQSWEEPAPIVFLLDSALPRRTAPLVSWFLEQMGELDFSKKLESTLLPAHETMLRSWLEGDAALFWPALRRVSQFQLEYMPPMIPSTVYDFWKKSLESEDLALKICGAGGGGFVLGFAKDREALAKIEQAFTIVFPLANAEQPLLSE